MSTGLERLSDAVLELEQALDDGRETWIRGTARAVCDHYAAWLDASTHVVTFELFEDSPSDLYGILGTELPHPSLMFGPE